MSKRGRQKGRKVCESKERNRHKRKGKKGRGREGNERTGEERKRGGKEKKEEEKGLHEQPSRKCEAPLPCQPA